MFDISKLLKWVVRAATAILIAKRLYAILCAVCSTGAVAGAVSMAVKTVLVGGLAGLAVCAIIGIGAALLRKKAQQLGLNGFVNF